MSGNRRRAKSTRHHQSHAADRGEIAGARDRETRPHCGPDVRAEDRCFIRKQRENSAAIIEANFSDKNSQSGPRRERRRTRKKRLSRNKKRTQAVFKKRRLKTRNGSLTRWDIMGCDCFGPKTGLCEYFRGEAFVLVVFIGLFTRFGAVSRL